jgi:hypothetical protein
MPAGRFGGISVSIRAPRLCRSGLVTSVNVVEIAV